MWLAIIVVVVLIVTVLSILVFNKWDSSNYWGD